PTPTLFPYTTLFRSAAALQARGIGSGDRVGILVNNRLEWLEACFGIAALGAVAVPISTWSKPGELAFLLADSEIVALFAITRFGDRKSTRLNSSHDQ